jgi:hypothetical protein
MTFSVAIGQDYFIRRASSTGAEFSIPTGTLNSNLVVTVYPHWYEQVSLEWSIPESWAGAKFHVYYASGGADSFTRLTPAPIDDRFFADHGNKDYRKAKEGRYVVEAILPFSSELVRSYPTTWEYRRRDKIEKIAIEIQRREYMLLSKFTGAKSYFLRKKTRGMRCPRCWNKTAEHIMDDHCPVCYGTSFDGGYFDPIPVYIQYDPSAANKRKAYYGSAEPNVINAWTISMPEMSSDDIIIRTMDWNVYKVTDVNCTELQTQPVKQVLTITQLARDDIENKLVDRAHNSNQLYLTRFETRFQEKRFPTNLLDTRLENDPGWAQEQALPNLPEYKV